MWVKWSKLHGSRSVNHGVRPFLDPDLHLGYCSIQKFTTCKTEFPLEDPVRFHQTGLLVARICSQGRRHQRSHWLRSAQDKELGFIPIDLDTANVFREPESAKKNQDEELEVVFPNQDQAQTSGYGNFEAQQVPLKGGSNDTCLKLALMLKRLDMSAPTIVIQDSF